MKALSCIGLLIFISECHLSPLSISPSGIAKQLHNGAYEAVKGTITGLTEVVGTPVDVKEVTFYLHTSKDNGYPNHTINPFQPAEIAKTKEKIYFFIHGWTQNREETPWFKPLTQFLLKKDPNTHVVQVDWSKPASDNYASSAFSTESVGNIIGNVIQKLTQDHHVPKENIILIGHSLGGQITGWVGKRFKELTNMKLPRIIALDPAGPLFSVRPDEKRLNKNDAEVVIVVHTDGGKFGFGDPTGTIDFFPNGGSDQPGCYKIDLAKISTFTEPVWCDHRRAYDLFVEAVKSPSSFMAKKCKDYDAFKENKCDNDSAFLGDLETEKTGTYYLKTGDKKPFVKEQENKEEKKKTQEEQNSENNKKNNSGKN